MTRMHVPRLRRSFPSVGSRASSLRPAGRSFSAGASGPSRPETLSYLAGDPPSPVGSITSNVGAGSVGVRIQPTQTLRVWSLRVYLPFNGYSVSELRIEPSDGSGALGVTPPLEPVAQTWEEADLASPVELEVGVSYRVLAQVSEVFRHYYDPAGPYSGPVTVLGGHRGGSDFGDAMGWCDIGYETV